jgi:hypothetical protein
VQPNTFHFDRSTFLKGGVFTMREDPNVLVVIQTRQPGMFPMPRSFPSGPANEPDGKFGDETYQTVLSFQRREFPQDPGQWDGRCGKNTLGRIDELLLDDSAAVTLPFSQVATSSCRRA